MPSIPARAECNRRIRSFWELGSRLSLGSVIISQKKVMLAVMLQTLALMPSPASRGTIIARQPVVRQPVVSMQGWAGDNNNKNFDPDAVPEDAKRRTLIRTLGVWGVVGATGLLVTSSGKTLSLDNAPGAAEQAKKKAEDKAAYLAVHGAALQSAPPCHGRRLIVPDSHCCQEIKERTDALSAKAAEDRAAGRKQQVPKKPWEK